MEKTEINHTLSFFNIYLFCLSPLPPIPCHCLHENYSWNRLPMEIVPFLSLEVFKIWLNADLSNHSWPQSCPCFEQDLGLQTSRGPFPPEWFCGSRVLQFYESMNPSISSWLWWELEGVNVLKLSSLSPTPFPISLTIFPVREDLNRCS